MLCVHTLGSIVLYFILSSTKHLCLNTECHLVCSFCPVNMPQQYLQDLDHCPGMLEVPFWRWLDSQLPPSDPLLPFWWPGSKHMEWTLTWDPLGRVEGHISKVSWCAFYAGSHLEIQLWWGNPIILVIEDLPALEERQKQSNGKFISKSLSRDYRDPWQKPGNL